MQRVVLSDESVNKYGMRILSAGIDMTEFRKNPIMLYDHDQYNRLPIGKWEDVKLEKGVLSAQPVFDMQDEFAAKVAEKWEKGMLNAASISFEIMESSDDPKLIMAGQRRPTVTRSRLREASIVPFPGNSNAYKLHFQAQGIELSGDVSETTLDALLPPIQKQFPKMDAIKTKLALGENATERDVIAAIDKLQENHQAQITQLRADMADAVITLGKERGIVAEGNEATFRQLAANHPAATLALIASQKPAEKEEQRESITQKLSERKPAPAADERSTWTLTDWRKKDPEGLGRMQLSEPEKFEALLATLKSATA